MRTYTLLFSILAHASAVVAVVVTSLAASDMLPAVRRAVDFIEVRPVTPPVPPPRRVRREPRVEPVPSAAVPIEVPEGIHEESPMQPAAASADTSVIAVDPAPLPEPVAIEPPARVDPREPVRVGGNIRPPQKVSSPSPVYPPIARAAGVQGVVILEAVIGEDGSVRDLKVLRSIPLLDAAAIAAVQQWRFSPSLLNGEPIAVVMTVTVGFSLR
jgi:protein TonB